MTRIIVCDTGPLLHLSEAGAIHLLSSVGEVLMPPLVAIEFEANAQGWQPPQWVRKVSLRRATRQKAENRYERNKLTLVKQMQSGWLFKNKLNGC
jgi:predicted nucleic acid-binding protein